MIISALSVIDVQELCDPTNTTYTVTFTIQGGDPTSYLITNGSGTLNGNIFTSDPILSGVAYGFTVDDGFGCTPFDVNGLFECACPGYTLTVEVTSDNNGFGVNCADATDGVAEVTNINGGNAPFDAVWSDGQTGLTASGLGAGNYNVTVTDADGCEEIESVTITAPMAITVESNTNEISCFGDSDGSIVIESVSGGTPPYLYSIDNGAFSPIDAFPNLGAGSYTIVVQDANGCEFSFSSTLLNPVELAVNAGQDESVQSGTSIQLNAIINTSSIDSVLWTPSDEMNCNNCLNPTLTPSNSETYNVTVIDGNGCTATDAISISVFIDRKVYIPNAFSPDGDGYNDYFTIYGGTDIANIKTLMIFDRWGDTIFENKDFSPNDLTSGWDGFFKGELMNPAVFVYVAEIEFTDCLLYTSPSPRDQRGSRMPSSA